MIFHLTIGEATNSQAGRKYLTMPDVFRHHVIGGAEGAGRLHAPFPEMQFSDTRVDTIADLNDVKTLPQCMTNPAKHISTDFVTPPTEDDLRLRIQMNALSRLWLNDILLIALRMIEQKSLNWEDEKLCISVGEKIRQTYVTSLHKYTQEPKDKCEIFSKNANINWKRLARQLMFWIDISEKGYPKYVIKGSIPRKIFGKKIPVQCASASSENFKANQFYSNNGKDIDIGGFNGALGLPELEKAWAIFSLWCVALAEYNTQKNAYATN